MTLEKLIHLSGVAHLQRGVKVLGQRLVSLCEPCSLLSTEDSPHGLSVNSTGLHGTGRVAQWSVCWAGQSPRDLSKTGAVWGGEMHGNINANPKAGTPAGERAQWVRGLAAKRDDPCSIPRTGRVERKELMPACCPLTSTYTWKAHACTHRTHVTAMIMKSVNGPDLMVGLPLCANVGSEQEIT